LGFSTGGWKDFGSSGVNVKEWNGRPAEAGTLSDADPPVPFGKIVKEFYWMGGGFVIRFERRRIKLK